jgi:hypothetical protein
MPFAPPPRRAAWEHIDARRGFEVAFFTSAGDGHRVEGTTAAVEGSEAWAVEYAIALDPAWQTTSAAITVRSAAGVEAVVLETDGRGRWHSGGAHLRALDGCMDVDLESSALTNAFPVHRLGLRIGQAAEAPAAYVRALDLRIERLAQSYLRLADLDGHERYHYRAPSFDFECELVYDGAGLVLDYPGIARRAA